MAEERERSMRAAERSNAPWVLHCRTLRLCASAAASDWLHADSLPSMNRSSRPPALREAWCMRQIQEEVTAVTSFVQIVNPAHEFRNLDRRDVEIDNEALLPTSCKYAVKLSLFARVDLLMRHIGRDVDEIPRRGLCDELQAIAPPQAGKAADHVDHTFEIPVMMRSRLCVGIDGYSAGPQFRRTSILRGHCRAPVHAERLSGGIVQIVGPNNSHAICSPSTGVPAHWLVSAL